MNVNKALSSKITRGFIISAIPLLILFTAVPAFAKKKVSAQRQEFINTAISLLNTPYVYGGHDPLDDGGLDCSGFVKYAAHTGIAVETQQTVAAMWENMKTVSVHDREPGDLVFFKTTGEDRISHVGIYLGIYHGKGRFHGKRIFISALSDGKRTGVRYSALDSSYWRSRYAGSKRFLESTEAYNRANGIESPSPVSSMSEENTDGITSEEILEESTENTSDLEK